MGIGISRIKTNCFFLKINIKFRNPTNSSWQSYIDNNGNVWCFDSYYYLLLCPRLYSHGYCLTFLFVRILFHYYWFTFLILNFVPGCYLTYHFIWDFFDLIYIWFIDFIWNFFLPFNFFVFIHLFNFTW